MGLFSRQAKQAQEEPRALSALQLQTLQYSSSVAAAEPKAPRSTKRVGSDDDDQRRAKPLNDRLSYWLFVGPVFLGIAAAAAIIALGAIKTLPKDKFCLVLHEDFSSGTLDPAIWQRQVETGGWGNKEFEWTTDSTNNSYIQDGMLHIVPTLTSDQLGEAAIMDGYTLNLTHNGCTASNQSDAFCAVKSNATTGTILPPIQSARLSTNISTAIKYGKVEVRARMPTGDWLWPAIWMMPRHDTYGGWPSSGEIDIMEGKGNRPKKRTDEDSNVMKSTLHWGARPGRTYKGRRLYRDYYDQSFHTFGLEWTDKHIFTYDNSPVFKNFAMKWVQGGFWKLGNWPLYSANGTTLLKNPWGSSVSAPFDQEFYLILNVAVGGANGYFEDGKDDNKPWLNSASNPARDFWLSRNDWLPTWPKDPAQRGMVVDWVKIWQKC
ncbi:uncharacterized protein PFL1_04448 [Pseudozyma flocculosa PF-1]|uniref:GH16 domain-containing protein n=1 Tax=Pseudozyma flocculosa PF-1 TaxID=1277687 RepID=A0A061HBY6_9BASI|nr:uncharacterized protein PFL1_04448 [Pseudozyma flocculosa PF-1]EPQ28121.1 hypothetical protein PFL1_04448 [Pseudozyma flocculosa PF-1]